MYKPFQPTVKRSRVDSGAPEASTGALVACLDEWVTLEPHCPVTKSRSEIISCAPKNVNARGLENISLQALLLDEGRGRKDP